MRSIIACLEWLFIIKCQSIVLGTKPRKIILKKAIYINGYEPQKNPDCKKSHDRGALGRDSRLRRRFARRMLRRGDRDIHAGRGFAACEKRKLRVLRHPGRCRLPHKKSERLVQDRQLLHLHVRNHQHVLHGMGPDCGRRAQG